MSATRIVPTCCNACGGQSGILAHVTDGRVVKLEPNSENPTGVANTFEDFMQEKSRGARMCPKGLAAIKQLYDPDRLEKPLRKTRRGEWEEISWEAALELAAERLSSIKENYGPEALLWFSEDHSFTHIQQDFCRAFGTPNYLNHSNLCDVARKAGFKLSLGDERPIADLANSKFILLFGWNPLAAIKWAYLPAALIRAIEKGAKVIVVDPVFTDTAAKASEWIPIRPGTDGVMALAMGHVIVRDNLYNKEFVEKWSIGFKEYANFVKDKDPAWAERITGVPAATISRLARELAQAKPAVVDAWSGVSHYSNGTEATRAIAMLLGLTGEIDGPGNLLLPERTHLKHRKPHSRWPVIKAARVDGAGSKYPFAHKSGVYLEAREAMLSGIPYQPRAAAFVFQNFMMSVPDTKKSLKALERLEFKMVFDLYLSETAAAADLVIPGSHFLERYDLTANWVSFPSISLRQPVIKPVHGGPTEYEFIMQLARELNMPGFDVDYESLLDAELWGSAGISLEQLRKLPGAVWNQGPTRYKKYEQRGFATPSGKFEFCSKAMEEKGLGSLPLMTDPLPEDPKYPLSLINWKSVVHTHTRTQNNLWLMEMEGGNPLWMNPLRAEQLGLADNDLVRLETACGEGYAKVSITPEIHPDAVGMVYGFGHRGMGNLAKGKGTNVNEFYEGKAEALTGQAILKEARVRVSKAEEGAKGED